MLHNEITSIIDRLSSPGKSKATPNEPNEVRNNSVGPIQPTELIEIESVTDQTTITAERTHAVQPDFIDNMHTDAACSEGAINSAMNFTSDVEKYRRMIPYCTSDPAKISQQESILELLISNGICDDETFKIFIAEPDSHKAKASQILDSLYCVSTMISIEYENDATATEWVNSVESIALVSDTASAPDLVGQTQPVPIQTIAAHDATASNGISGKICTSAFFLIFVEKS